MRKTLGDDGFTVSWNTLLTLQRISADATCVDWKHARVHTAVVSRMWAGFNDKIERYPNHINGVARLLWLLLRHLLSSYSRRKPHSPPSPWTQIHTWPMLLLICTL